MRKQILNLRRIGCSDLATVVDRDPYHEPVNLWARLLHSAELPESPWLVEAGEWGKALEETIAREGLRRIGLGRVPVYRPPSLEPASRAWERYSADFVAGVDEGQLGLEQLAEPRLVECKVRNSRSLEVGGWGEAGTAEVGIRELCQGQGLLEALRADRDAWVGTTVPEIPAVDYFVLVDGQQLRHYHVPYDPELAGLLVQEAERFWRDYVVTRSPPPLQYTEYTAHELRRRFPRLEDKGRAAPPEAQPVAAELAEIKEELRRLEQREQALTLRLEELAAGAPQLASVSPRWKWTQWEAKPKLAWGTVLKDLAARAGLEGAALEAYLDTYRGAPQRASRLTYKGDTDR